MDVAGVLQGVIEKILRRCGLGHACALRAPPADRRISKGQCPIRSLHRHGHAGLVLHAQPERAAVPADVG
jgi:hypothetical protein